MIKCMEKLSCDKCNFSTKYKTSLLRHLKTKYHSLCSSFIKPEIKLFETFKKNNLFELILYEIDDIKYIDRKDYYAYLCYEKIKNNHIYGKLFITNKIYNTNELNKIFENIRSKKLNELLFFSETDDLIFNERFIIKKYKKDSNIYKLIITNKRIYIDNIRIFNNQ